MKNISNIQALLSEEILQLKNTIEVSVESDIELLTKINNHIFLSTGKMLRPILSMLTAKACVGHVSNLVLITSAATELIHTATLLHDDVVDGSLLRREKPTVFSLFSPGASVLMGDFWLTKAIDLLIYHECSYDILRKYSKTIHDLAEGEMLQMQRSEDLKMTRDDYLRIISYKTGSLFNTTISSTLEIIGAESSVKEGMMEYISNLGIAFQIRDDILDYSIDPKDGKDVLVDIKERKITLPLLIALEKASNDERDGVKEIISKIDPQAELDKSVLEDVLSFIRKYHGVELSKEILNDYIEKAKSGLKVLPNSAYKEALLEILNDLTL